MRESTKGLLKAAVLTVGVADCIGIYITQHRLTQPVPADIQYDAAYASPGETGVFHPDQGMPTLGPRLAAARLEAARPEQAHPASAKLADAQTAGVKAGGEKAGGARAALAAAQTPQFALVAPAIAPLHHAASAAAPGSVRLARINSVRLARSDPSASPAAQPNPARHSAHGVTAQSSASPLAGLVPTQEHTRLFADAFGSGFANVPLDAPITQQLDDEPGWSGLAEDGSTADVQLAHNGGVAPVASDAAKPSSAASELPASGPAVTLPDTDKL